MTGTATECWYSATLHGLLARNHKSWWLFHSRAVGLHARRLAPPEVETLPQQRALCYRPATSWNRLRLASAAAHTECSFKNLVLRRIVQCLCHLIMPFNVTSLWYFIWWFLHHILPCGRFLAYLCEVVCIVQLAWVPKSRILAGGSVLHDHGYESCSADSRGRIFPDWWPIVTF